tara:strand:+ start:2178 stop:2687 length:510 start_codon:yes stop_codon:yes gene_type:complete
MGLFDDIGSFFSKTAKKAVKGIKRLGKKVVKGVKKGAKVLKSEVEGLGNPEAWKQGLVLAGKALQAPQKAVEKWDPLRKKMGDFGGFSPISLATGIITAPISGAGYFSQMAGDKKLQKKLKSGDADTIMDTAFAGLGLLPAGAIGAGGKAVGRGAKALKRGIKGLRKVK